MRPHGVVGADGVERAVDTIILGTGFTITDLPIAARVRGRDGRSLDEAWQGSPTGYLGSVVNGFPNFFILLGPNIGNGHSSAFVLSETQIGYMIEALRAMSRGGLASVEVRAETQERFNDEVQSPPRRHGLERRRLHELLPRRERPQQHDVPRLDPRAAPPPRPLRPGRLRRPRRSGCLNPPFPRRD